ncbi:MAG: flagellar biosynthesis protein FlhB [Candidatus Cloacimonetes bacterium]|nr:flagellar biosynthesis protein FlhB [Candidatus Cloacimonadota bacterium]MDD4156192.1 flagellar biosynthesis protein FlhB [Candidatus Cloacimonadota bacterium]
MADDSEKTEEPTGKRLNQARKKGDVPRSSEVDTAIFLLMFLIIIKIGGPYIVAILKDFYIYSFNSLNTELSIPNLQNVYIKFLYNFWIILLPISTLLIISGLVSMLLQVGWLVTFENIKPKFDVFNFKGLKEIFSPDGLKKLVKGNVKLIILALLTWMTLRKFLNDMLGLVNLNIVSIYLFLINLVVRIIISLLIFYAFFAVIDFVWTKFNHRKKLKMTKSEVKDEFKQMEGDPQVKRKILKTMMEESMKRMMKEIPEADVVITNPIHLAVAIKYDLKISEAPIVVAKGKRLIAEKIKQLARDNDIPIIEDKPLARLLYKNSNIGKPIDVQFYAAVAEILAQVYKVKNKHI